MLISQKDVSLHRQGKVLLSHIHYQVKKGENCSILGLNGSLLRLILAELWQSFGEVEVLGTPFGQRDISKLLKKIRVISSFITKRFPSGMAKEGNVLAQGEKTQIFTLESLSDFYSCPVKLIELEDERYFVKTEVPHA